MTLESRRVDLGNDQVTHRQIVATISPKLQQLIILPTEKCNFRCTYCYEDFLIGKMKEPVQASIERYMDRRVPELTGLSLQWFGGEPLLAKSVVLRLSSHAYRLCEQYDVGLEGSLTTNGYLLEPALFRELVSYRQRYFQITLDGWDEQHNVVRKLANGGGSFERIWSNLLATREHPEDFTIQIRVHVRRDNFESLHLLMMKLAEAFGGDRRYVLDFQHLRDLGGAGGKTIDRPVSPAELRMLEADLRAEYEAAVAAKLGSRQVDVIPAYASEAVSGKPSDLKLTDAVQSVEICYAAKPNSLLIRADGRIGKCTVALTDDRNTLGAINPDGTVTIDSGKLKPWIRGLASLDREELECPLGGMAHATV